MQHVSPRSTARHKPRGHGLPFFLVLALVAAAVIAISWSDSGNSHQRVHIAITDNATCVATDDGGNIRLDSSGLSPGDYYMSLLHEPNNVDWSG
jgi:ferric-dicitrate binding protein FerR (iron transport regulator)